MARPVRFRTPARPGASRVWLVNQQEQTLKWQEPTHKVTYDWPTVEAKLRSKPMEWLQIFEKDRRSVANALNQGNIPILHPDLGFECTTRNNAYEPSAANPNHIIRVCSLYMRFNPDAVKHELRGVVTEHHKRRK